MSRKEPKPPHPDEVYLLRMGWKMGDRRYGHTWLPPFDIPEFTLSGVGLPRESAMAIERHYRGEPVG